MTARYFALPVIKPGLSDVLGRLGYNPKKTELDDRTLGLVEGGISYSMPYNKPVGLSVDCLVAGKGPESVTLDCGIVFRSKRLALIMKNCVSATVLACTIGSALTGEIVRLTEEGEISRAVILDAAASESVEAFAQYINSVLAREKVLRNLKPVMRFSPGYGDLKTDIQPEILKLLGAEKIGLTCSPENFILKPEKSITAIIGWESK
jgi:hypothetical protein